MLDVLSFVDGIMREKEILIDPISNNSETAMKENNFSNFSNRYNGFCSSLLSTRNDAPNFRGAGDCTSLTEI